MCGMKGLFVARVSLVGFGGEWCAGSFVCLDLEAFSPCSGGICSGFAESTAVLGSLHMYFVCVSCIVDLGSRMCQVL